MHANRVVNHAQIVGFFDCEFRKLIRKKNPLSFLALGGRRIFRVSLSEAPILNSPLEIQPMSRPTPAKSLFKSGIEEFVWISVVTETRRLARPTFEKKSSEPSILGVAPRGLRMDILEGLRWNKLRLRLRYFLFLHGSSRAG